MPILRLPTDAEAEAHGFRGASAQRRRDVLRETIDAFERCTPSDYYHRLAKSNIVRWESEFVPSRSEHSVLVLQGDWGEVTKALTKKYGTCFAILNMANSYYPGGAYGEGAIAQEENMFRRTDCHFQVLEEELDRDGRIYTNEMTNLLTAKDGRVYLNTTSPRVCIRGPEERSLPDLGYAWLAESEVFPFFELRAAAQDLRDGDPFSHGEARNRIAAQLDTLCAQGVRHAVLGAFGCGAFLNPALDVARLYRDEIRRRADKLTVVAFAIFSAGYGRNNYLPFRGVLENADAQVRRHLHGTP